MLRRRPDNRDGGRTGGPAAARPGREGAPNQSLARGLAILEAFSAETAELGVRELSRRLRLDKSIVHRLARTLAGRGFLEQNPETLRYRVGPRTFEVGQQYAPAARLTDAALPVLRGLARERQLNTYLGVLHEDAVLYLVALQSSGPIAIRATPGSRAQLHSTALGKVLLAAEPDGGAARLLGPGPLPRLTPATLVDPAAVLAQLAQVRRTGHAISDEENLPGVFAVGAPVRDRSGHVTAAISGARPRWLTPDARVPELARVVLEAAAAISHALGAPATDRSPFPRRTA
jgi:DNA-binding IclR family transcriptional regulator